MLIGAGVVFGLGLYTGTTGFVGRGLTSGSGAVFGLARFLLPIILIAAGWQVLRSKKRKRKKSKVILDYVTAFLPWVTLGAAVFCVLDLIGGRPYWGSPVADLSRAGGWLGVWIGGSIESALGLVGEIVVTVVLFIVAAILLTSMSLGSAADSLADRLGLLSQRVRQGFSGVRFRREPLEGQVEDAPRRCLLYTSPSPRDATLSRMPSSA